MLNRLLLIRIAFCVTTLVAVVPAFAQDSGSNPDEISLYLGSMLPNQIPGVTEILPVAGGRYGIGTRLGTFEFGGANSHASGIDFTTFEADLRGDFPVAEGLLGIGYGGFDYNWYSPIGSSNRQSETGFHVGVGAMMLASNTLWLRTDLKFMGGPGTSLYLLFGFVFRGVGGP